MAGNNTEKFTRVGWTNYLGQLEPTGVSGI